MRAGRLVALVLLVQREGGMTAAALARQLEVSERTIYRDVATLQASGIPLWTETGPGGGVRLVDGWTMKLDGLTGAEAGALFLAGAPSAAAELGLGAVLAAAQAKVLSTLPPELRGRAGRVRERFHIDAPGWFHREESLPCLGAVAEAVWSQQRVDVQYRSGEAVVSRRLDCLGLVMKAGVWYVVASRRGAIRTYRVARIVRVTPRRERFVRPERFDLASFWTESSAAFDRSVLRSSVSLRLSPAAVRLLPHITDPVAAREAVSAAGPADEEGWRRVELAVESPEVAVSQLLALGSGVEVLDPVEVRQALGATGRALAARNGSLGAPGR
ncbi:MAG: transcriptional regulator [Acidimicrobiia bacterium]|nr:transcriptional regulator [Acidimicrobiia bacterium]